MTTRKLYSKEFKLDAISLVLEQGYSRAHAARSLEINPNMLGSWIKEHESVDGQAFRGNGKLTAEQSEIRHLREENRRLKMEKDILKKATVDSTGQCNMMCLNHFRDFQEAASFKNKRPNDPAEVRTVGQVEKRSVAQ